MAINLPRSEFSGAPQPQRRRVPTEAILSVLGNNPYAKAIDQISPVLSKALLKRAETRKLAQQTAIAKQQKLQSMNAMAAEEQGQIRLLEKHGGFKPGELGNDFKSALAVFNQSKITGRSERNAGLREQGLETSESNAFKNRLNNQKNRMVNDARIKPLHSQNIGLKQISEVADIASNGNTVAAAALGVKMARGMGEVGVLTESDISRYVTSGRLDRKAADKLSSWLRGRPTDATIGEIRQIASVLSDSFQSKMQPVYNEYIESFAEVEGLSPDDVSRKMAIPYAPASLPNIQKPGPGPLQGESPAQRKARLLNELKGAR